VRFYESESWERRHPYFVAALLFIVLSIVLCNVRPAFTSAFDNVISTIVIIVSILMGFVGVLLALLVSVRHTTFIVQLFKIKSPALMKKYFSNTLVSGFLLVVLSAVLYLRSWIYGLHLPFEIDLYIILIALWVSMIAYVALAFRRVVNIMMDILFKSNEESKKDEYNEMDEDSARLLAEKYRRQK